MIRLAHFSDIHVCVPRFGWKVNDWFSKRLTSWLHHRYRRAKRFALAEEIVGRLMDDLLQRGIDHVIFSGDATAVGFESEIRRAAETLRLGQFPIPGLAVPGNHDYCTPAAEASGAFERHFAPWQHGQRIGPHRYPFAQRVGHAWLIGVNAATGNRWPWDAGGSVDEPQLNRLQALLTSLEPGLKILVVHYPICLSTGLRESRRHGLRNLDRLLAVAHAGGVNLWLHGHRHTPYYVQQPEPARFPAICAGTATQHGIWSYGEYAIDGNTLQAVRRIYDPQAHRFHDVEAFTLELR